MRCGERLLFHRRTCGEWLATWWAALTKCSADTAQRDLKELLEPKLLAKNPGGSKNTSYSLRL